MISNNSVICKKHHPLSWRLLQMLESVVSRLVPTSILRLSCSGPCLSCVMGHWMGLLPGHTRESSQRLADHQRKALYYDRKQKDGKCFGIWLIDKAALKGCHPSLVAPNLLVTQRQLSKASTCYCGTQQTNHCGLPFGHCICVTKPPTHLQTVVGKVP
jgi:hypothetical protein